MQAKKYILSYCTNEILANEKDESDIRVESLSWDEVIALISSENFEINSITLSIDKSNFEVSGYADKISKIVQSGQISTYVEWHDVGLIQLLYCIERGGNGDMDGYGVKPDSWIVAFLDVNGNFKSPFSLSDSELNVNIENILNKGMNPFGSNA